MEYLNTRLSVNINKVALIRNSRGGNRPDLIRIAQDIERFGGEGITIHPRPDERHIRFSDIQPLKLVNTTEFNIEGYPSAHFLTQVLKNKPDQCTLVPDPPGALTSDSGWDTLKDKTLLEDVIGRLKEADIRTAVFVDPDPIHVEGAAKVGADRIELYTGKYANEYKHNRDEAVKPHMECAEVAQRIGIGVNAGHDLGLDNLAWYKSHVYNLLEVSIGHAIISDALYFGLENVIAMYKRQLFVVNT